MRRGTVSGPSRRAALTGSLVVGAAWLSGCTRPSSADPADPASDATSDEGTDGPQRPGTDDADADLQTLGAALALTAGLLDLIAAVGDEHRPLRRRLAGFRALHQEHQRQLARAHDEPEVETPRTPRVPGAAPAAMRLVRKHETAAREELLGLCVAARSGPFAQLLASMSAGIAAHSESIGWDV